MNLLSRKSSLWVIGSLIIWYILTFLSRLARYLHEMPYELRLIKDGRETWYPKLMFYDQDYSIINLFSDFLVVIILSWFVYIIIKNKDRLLNIAFGILYGIIGFKIIIYLKYDLPELVNDHLSLFTSILLATGIITLIISLHINKLIGYYISIASFVSYILLKMYEVISMIRENLNSQFRIHNVMDMYLFLLLVVVFIMTIFISILKYNKYAIIIASIIVSISVVICWNYVSKNYHDIVNLNLDYFYSNNSLMFLIFEIIPIIIYSGIALIGIHNDTNIKIKYPNIAYVLVSIIILKLITIFIIIDDIINYSLSPRYFYRYLTVLRYFDLVSTIFTVGIFIWIIIMLIKNKSLILPVFSIFFIIGIKFIKLIYILTYTIKDFINLEGIAIINLLSSVFDILAPLLLIIGIFSYLKNKSIYGAKKIIILSIIAYSIYIGLMLIYSYKTLHIFPKTVFYDSFIDMIFYTVYLSFFVYLLFRLSGKRLASILSLVVGAIIFGFILYLMYENVYDIIEVGSSEFVTGDVRRMIISMVPTCIISSFPLIIIYKMKRKAIDTDNE